MKLSTETLQRISKLSNDYNNRTVATGIGDESHRQLRLVSLYHGAEIVQKEVDKLQAFKDFVHKRLDEAGVPTNPDGEHSKQGCRIGDRLDIVLSQAITLPEGLHPDSKELVKELAEALASKMLANQEKYGWTNQWLTSDWEKECRAEMIEHIEKGDPRDVAIYCAFMIHHRWPTTNKAIEVDHSNDTVAE